MAPVSHCPTVSLTQILKHGAAGAVKRAEVKEEAKERALESALIVAHRGMSPATAPRSGKAKAAKMEKAPRVAAAKEAKTGKRGDTPIASPIEIVLPTRGSNTRRGRGRGRGPEAAGGGILLGGGIVYGIAPLLVAAQYRHRNPRKDTPLRQRRRRPPFPTTG